MGQRWVCFLVSLPWISVVTVCLHHQHDPAFCLVSLGVCKHKPREKKMFSNITNKKIIYHVHTTKHKLHTAGNGNDWVVWIFVILYYFCYFLWSAHKQKKTTNNSAEIRTEKLRVFRLRWAGSEHSEDRGYFDTDFRSLVAQFSRIFLFVFLFSIQW